ncbi:DNA translocase FtsK [Bartonella tamiae]|uniref:DNA translocase FtsK n=1 Tax=Bartonella tamiae Th239 TaxID=1094558 RepID=J0QZE4_9HYPH|nr:DNA translocase FtsK [Bartonella tamiae]EJF91506.1 DNA translocase ftsK [Bartonella tamiae Th239]EJF92510.1 DNA translocase ftsK [Bartonella tamiae Th307]
MRQGSSSYDYTTDTAYQSPRLFVVFSRQIGAFIGIGLFLLIGLAGAALATWNVADPSLSYAHDRPVSNILGYPGAVFSDIAMQFFGLASVAALLPPFFWAVLLIAQKHIDRPFRRMFFWFFSLLCFAALMALIPPFAHWPMPIGLGGVFGDKILALLSAFIPSINGFVVTFCSALIFAPLAFFTMAVAGGVIGRAKPKKLTKVKSRRNQQEDFDDNQVSQDNRGGFFVTLFGGSIHLLYWIKTLFRNVFFSQRYNAGHKKTSYHQQREKLEPGFESLQAVQNDAKSYDNNYENIHNNRRDQQSFESSYSLTPNGSNFGSHSGFELPLLDYLAEPQMVQKSPALSPEKLKDTAAQLENVLDDFGIKGQIIHVRPGPVVTLYEFEPAPGIKSSRIIGLADDIARSMSAISARVAVVSGRNVIGIELPNPMRETVYLREIMQTQEFYENKAKLGLALGKTIDGDAVIADLTKMPHLLVAGTTGSGKSVAINTMILSLLYRMSPEQCRLIMVDPKMLELSVYDGIPHLLTPVVTDPKKAVVALKWAVREMEERYRQMAKVGVRNIEGFNARIKEAEEKGESLSRTVQTGFDRETGKPIYETEVLHLTSMPFIVVIIDEMADLMMVAGKDIEGAVQRLAQMARAAGIHVIMATQRPSVDVITGTIKANFPTRISFSVTSKIDSRTILGEQGAEQLLGQGDMLFMMGGGRIQRVHGPFVGDDEVEKIVHHLKAQGVPHYLDAITEDDGEDTMESDSDQNGAKPMSEDPYDQAVAVVLRDRKVSTSYIQRRLGIGYNRAATIIERMEEEGLISEANHAGKREILVPEQEAPF